MQAYHPRFYDHYFTGVEGDVEFYVDAALEAGSPVLELGCGTGRVLLPTAAAGVEVVGLEVDEAILGVTRRKLANSDPLVREMTRLVRADMEEFDLNRRFRLVTIPYRSFQHLLTPTDQHHVLECVHRHLEDGGVLVLDIFDPLMDIAGRGFTAPLQKDTDFADPETGHSVTVWYSRQYDPEVQLLEQELIFEETDRTGEVVSRTYGRLQLRYIFRYEMEYLLERCGFAVEALYGDFHRSVFPGYGEQIWVARKV